MTDEEMRAEMRNAVEDEWKARPEIKEWYESRPPKIKAFIDKFPFVHSYQFNGGEIEKIRSYLELSDGSVGLRFESGVVICGEYLEGLPSGDISLIECPVGA